MNTEFNYYDFLKKKEFKYEVKVDLSGLNLQAGASTSEVDENGNASEVNLSEVVDENINFIYTPDSEYGYTYIDEAATLQYRYRGMDVVEVDKIDFDTDPNPTTINLNGTILPITPRHKWLQDDIYPVNLPINAAQGTTLTSDSFGTYHVLTIGIGTLTIPIPTFTSDDYYNTYYFQDGHTGTNRVWVTISGSSIESLNGEFEISSCPSPFTAFNIRTPINLGTLSGTLGTVTSLRVSAGGYKKRGHLVSRDAFAALGLFSNRNYNTSYNSKTSVFARGYLSKKAYYRRLKELQDRMASVGIEVVTNEFRSKIVTNSVGPFTTEYDANYSYLHRGATYNEMLVASRQFLMAKQSVGELLPLENDDITPFTMSMKSAFIAQFSTAEELLEEYVGHMMAVINAINNSTFITTIVGSFDLSSYTQYPNLDTTLFNVTDELINKVKQIQNVIPASISGLYTSGNPASAVIVATSLNDINDEYALLSETIRRIKWFQKFTNQSVFTWGNMFPDSNKSYGNSFSDAASTVGTGRISEDYFPYDKQCARILIPVDFGTKRQKYKKKNWLGHKVTAYKTIDMGVRWVEIYMIDTNVYTKYRKNDTPSGDWIPVNIGFSSLTRTSANTVIGTLSSALSREIMSRDYTTVTVVVTGSSVAEYNGTFVGTVLNSTTVAYTIPTDTLSIPATGGVLGSILVKYQLTKTDDEPRNIRVAFNMPHLPYDDELRDKVFNDYGPFDQGAYANKRRGGDYTVDSSGNTVENTDITGWEIFHESSKEVSAMRMGIDIYNKTQFLIKILETEFGKSRVNVIETMRSFDDQNTLQLGGAASNFLSWHNYGLAIKIKITQNDGITPIKDGSSDMLKLLDIADAFCTAAKEGKLGTPMNVVWCGQLVTGPDIFVWEFLPIGVGHKDAIKFRDAIYQQKDPIKEFAYVNVTEAGYIISPSTDVPTSSPYIKSNSRGIDEAIVINNQYWVHPKYIENYQTPSGLILKDIQEFLMLVKGKMDGNGTLLTGRKLVSEWKAKNPVSFRQLVMFYGMTGAMTSARGLLAGDYIQKFQTFVNKYAEKNPVQFVKSYLGTAQYNNVRIYLEDLTDSSYINLADGTLVTPVLEARSKQPEGNGNSFGQKQIDYNTVEFGQYQGGVFIPEGDSRIITIKTSKSVIEGYVDGNPINKDAVLLHTLVANQIVDEFKSIIELFNGLKIKFMHDSFYTGSNKSLETLLENEFGVIASQDIMSFDQLRDMYKRILINSRKTEIDGTVRGAGPNIESGNRDSIFEPLISTAQLSGARRVDISREKPVIEPLSNGIKVEDVVMEIKKQRTPRVHDIL